MHKKWNIRKTGIILGIVLFLAVGGNVFAYLYSNSSYVVNVFAANGLEVQIRETTAPDYNIVPGTNEAKDPFVTVVNSEDAYVYVLIDDQTRGLVSYKISDGWSELDRRSLTSLNSTQRVYYREVKSTDTVKHFSVLKGNRVHYASSIGNDDMMNSDGSLKSDLKLIFKAHGVQTAGFADAKDAFERTYKIK